MILSVVSFFLKNYRISNKDVSIAFVGDTVMRRINKKYRDNDRPTDVLSFRDEGNFLGEVLIDYAQIKRQAHAKRSSVKSELVFILVHGLLHLIGLDDKTEVQARKMDEIGISLIILMKKRNII